MDNLNSYTNRSDEEIRADNLKKYLPQVQKEYRKKHNIKKQNKFIQIFKAIISIWRNNV